MAPSESATIIPEAKQEYHNADSPYAFPKASDAVEQDRLDAQAVEIVKMIGGTPFLAFKNVAHDKVKTAVDVGFGTGVATLQLAKGLPQAKVYGLDLSPVPEAAKAQAPSNISWVVGNVLEVDSDPAVQQVLAPGSLDYIFGRMLILGINDWAKYYASAAQALRPGGIIEHQDIDWAWYQMDTNERISKDWEWNNRFSGVSEKAGLNMTAGSYAEKGMKDAGLEVIDRQTFEWTCVPSPKRPQGESMARYSQETLMPRWPALARKALEKLGLQEDHLERLIEDAKRDLLAEEGMYIKYTVTVARKP